MSERRETRTAGSEREGVHDADHAAAGTSTGDRKASRLNDLKAGQ